MFIPITFIVAHATVHGMSPHLAQYLVCILNATRQESQLQAHAITATSRYAFSLFGRSVPNSIADKVGHFNILIVMGVSTTIIILGLWLPSTGNTPIILFAALFGVFLGCWHQSYARSVCQALAHSRHSRPPGTVFTIFAFARLTGLPIGGAIISSSGGSFTNAIPAGSMRGVQFGKPPHGRLMPFGPPRLRLTHLKKPVLGSYDGGTN